MSTINTDLFSMTSSIFSTGSTTSSSSKSGSSSSSNMLGDYAAIKNGSYKKLLNAYYTKQDKEAATDTTKTVSSIKLMQQDALDLKKAADVLTLRGEDSLFNKVTTTVTDAATGVATDTVDYDYEAIYKAATTFTDAYNSMLDSAGDVSNSLITKKTNITASMFATNAALLKDAGITIGSDKKLTINKKDFLAADISSLKTIFNGTNSIADKISKRATDFYTTAQKVLSNTKNTYGNTGTYTASLTTGTLYDSLL